MLRKVAAPAGPHRLVLSHDGRFLAAASGRSCQVRCWNVQSGALIWERTINDAFNLHGLAFSPDDKELIATHIHDRHRSIGQTNIAEGWALDNRLTRLTLKPNPRTDYWQIALDVRGKAVGDPCAAAFSADNQWLTVAAGGTHELLIFQNSGDSLEWRRLPRRHARFHARPRRRQTPPASAGRLARGRAVRRSQRHSRSLANYLLDAVQIVDVSAGKLVRQVQLRRSDCGPTLVRAGRNHLL